MARTLLFVVEEEEILLRDFLSDKISGKALKKIKSEGALLVNNELRTVRYRLKKGDFVEVVYPNEEKGLQMEAIKGNLNIVYEDDYFLVINKEKGVPCIPSIRYSNTLANSILYYYKENNIDSTVHFVNRLDKDTSGLLLVCKYAHEKSILTKTKIERKYLCIVEGKLLGEGVIELPIYKDGLKIKRIIDERGRYSKTYYKGINYLNGHSLVECILETGRTHQIRVHMASVDHPLVNDGLYNEKCLPKDAQVLHSYYLSFDHPYLKRRLVFKTMEGFVYE